MLVLGMLQRSALIFAAAGIIETPTTGGRKKQKHCRPKNCSSGPIGNETPISSTVSSTGNHVGISASISIRISALSRGSSRSRRTRK